MPTAEALNRIISLLKEDRVQEAANLSVQLATEVKAAEDLAAGKAQEPPPPRQSGPIVLDLLHEIVAHLGHTPRMAALINELDEATAKLE